MSSSKLMYLSYGMAALKGNCPALTGSVTAKPSFTLMSPLMGMDYFGLFDGFFGAYSAEHMAEWLHIAVAMGIHDEMYVEAPRFLQSPDVGLVGWWRKTILDAFRLADDELIAKVKSGVAVGSPAVAALVLEKYLVLANRGATCRAVIYRGEEAVQLTSGRTTEQTEQQDVKDASDHVVGSTCNLQDNMATSRDIWLFRPYFPKPEVLIVEREPRDKFLILATGGLWDYVTPAEACSFIQKRIITMTRQSALDDMGSPTILAEELAEFASHKGSRGNVTLVVILFKNFWDENLPGTSKK